MNELQNLKLMSVTTGGANAPSSALERKQPAASDSTAAPVQPKATPLDTVKADTSRQVVAEEGNELPAAKEISQENVVSAVNSINEAVQEVRRDISFSVDSESGLTVVKVLDTATGETVRQLPSEVALKLAERLQNKDEVDLLKGNLFSAEA